MNNIPQKLFERDINDIEIGVSDIHLYDENEIEDGQLGFRVDSDGNPISEWPGNNYFIIGNDSACGDPIIADISNEELPIYSMFSDDWSTLSKIANSYKDYLEILKMISKTNIADEMSKEELIDKIKSIVSESSYDYWVSLIQVAYEFYNDID